MTATTVTIGSHHPLTGPAAAGLGDAGPAMKAYFDYVNDHGGVNGRKIVFNDKDDAYNPAKTVDVMHQLVEQDNVFAIVGGLGTPTHTKVVDYLNAQKVPDLFVGSGCTCWDSPSTHPYTFGWPTDYVREGKVLGTYVASAFPGKKIAYFTQDDALGADGIKGLDAVLPASSVVSRQTYQPGNLDINPQMDAIAQSKADVIVAFAIPTYLAQLKIAQLKTGNSAQLVASFAGADPTTLSALLAPYAQQSGEQGNSLVQGIVTDSFTWPISDTTTSWYALYKKVRDTYAPSLPLSQATNFGMSIAYTFVQALQRAGKNPTRQSIVDATEQGNFTGPGLVPFGFSKTSRAGYTGTQIGVIQGDRIVLQGQPMTTDAGDGPVTPYTTPPATAPADGIPTP
ncbi:ABC transporter substrate-binding protein [Kitasatospora sp. NPDC048540]|uniref:ABC transporter substrate-binding protein n=1 Tax=unclassified Kitasatospora TaxID=2633591 RepID=UPI001E376644|nr:ABC transporter substrate-binding protein [Kitasatospora sp. MBT63]